MFGSLFNYRPSGAPGLMGQQQGEVRATIYPRNSLSSSPVQLDGRTYTDNKPCIVQAQIQLGLGTAGRFALTLKIPESNSDLAQIQDDDWIDIELGRNAIFWHVLRGMVDEVRRSVSVGPSGSLNISWLVSGQSFQKVWVQTPMWFSGLLGDATSLQTKQGSTELLGLLGIGENVPRTIASFLYSYTNRVARAGRSSIDLPRILPASSGSFGDTWRFDSNDFSDIDAPRQNHLVNAFQPNQNVWDVAQSWSDPYFVEMFCAQLPSTPTRLVRREGSLSKPQQVNAISAMLGLTGEAEPLPKGLSVAQSAMTLVVRNKPFIHISPNSSTKFGFASPWFSLPMLQVPPQTVVSTDLGRSGFERFNAFLCASQVLTGTGGGPLSDVALPLWSEPDMRKHGMRPMDVVTNYLPVPKPPLSSPVIYRRLRSRLRDYYCGNFLYLSGSVTFGRAYPQLQPGMRLRLLQDNEKEQVTGYVESVTHSFSAGNGLSTVAGITRAYSGSDASHLADLQAIVKGYTAPFS